MHNKLPIAFCKINELVPVDVKFFGILICDITTVQQPDFSSQQSLDFLQLFTSVHFCILWRHKCCSMETPKVPRLKSINNIDATMRFTIL